jgi:regulator of protease activity HflC (stomatin/prohibitin superfamily)
MRQMQATQMMRPLGVFGAEPAGRVLRRGRRLAVNQWEQGLLFRHGRLETVLGPGPHRRWGAGFTLRAIDMRPWVLVVPTQEVPTADGATVKVTVAGQAHVAEATTYVTAARDAEQGLYLAIQVALRELVATTTVDDLLTGRGDVGGRLVAGVRGLDALGIAVDQLEVKDIILPGELKRAQTEVLVARAQGTAALERARGETAALRALANAARMAADNPALMQLRLLQQLEASTGHTVVIGMPPLNAAVVSSAVATGATAPPPAEPPTLPGSS